MSTERLRAACASLDADVLALQEIDRGQPRSHGDDQTAEVAEAMGAAVGNWRFVPAIVGEPGRTWRPAADDDADAAGSEPGYGVGLVSRLPVRAWHVLRLAAAPVRSPVVVPGGGTGRAGVILLPDEPRVAVAADLGALVVATTHLSFVPGWNLRQLRQVVAWLATLHEACVLVGDLNVPGPLPRWCTGWRSLVDLKTFPADRPRLQVDHALGRGLGRTQGRAIAAGAAPAVRRGEARKMPLSDHRALVLELGSEQWP